MECALLLACALPAVRSGPPWGPVGRGRVAQAGARRGARRQRVAGMPAPPRRSREVSPFLLQALQLCCLCCASVASALAGDSSVVGGGSGLNHGSYSPSTLRKAFPGTLTLLSPPPPKREKVDELTPPPTWQVCTRPGNGSCLERGDVARTLNLSKESVPRAASHINEKTILSLVHRRLV